MFRIDQIMTVAQFVRSFQEVANYLSLTSASSSLPRKTGGS